MKISVDMLEVSKAVGEYIKKKYPLIKIQSLQPTFQTQGHYEDTETTMTGFEAIIMEETDPEELMGNIKLKDFLSKES